MNVEIWSDIACPWCYVGKRRFEAALAAYEHRDEVQVTWRSFELDPAAPREREHDGATRLSGRPPGPRRERGTGGGPPRAEKSGRSRDEALAMQERMTAAAAGDGLE